MTIQLTIIGLGQIGTSIGMALANQQELLRRVGHDRVLETAHRAEKLGGLDRVEINLFNAIKDADLVILSLPMDQIRETLGLIAHDLKEGAVVMDTGPVKEVVSAWAGEILPSGRFYVGLTPVLNPAYLHGADSGIEAAKADLFRGGLIGIVTPPRTPSEAIKLAADLTRLLGATPLFADPLEIDSLMAATHLMPQLVASALLNATVDQPGWREGRKLASRAYAEVTAPVLHFTDPKSLSTSVMLNRENILRVMDSVLAALQALRNDIDTMNTDALDERLGRAHQGWEKWWKQRQAGDWANGDAMPANESGPPSSDLFGRLLGLGRKSKPKK